MTNISLTLAIALFIVAAAVIGYFGVRMTHIARDLAAKTGLGEALMGAVFIGASTSLSGIIASVSAASYGHAEFAVSNALGGIAAQTVFLAVADMFYRKANLEHAAASAENLMMSAILISMLSIPVFAIATPNLSLWSVHPASIMMVAGYILSVRLLTRIHKMPMWLPVRTMDTKTEPTGGQKKKIRFRSPLWINFILYSVIVGLSGWLLSISGIAISVHSGLSEGVVGGIFVAVSTSLPELVIAITAVRLKSLTLAVGDIIGGNTFDTLFIAFSDVAYRKGSIFAHISDTEKIWLSLTMLMTGVILMGLLHRERHGIANIGWESFTVLLIYLLGLGLILTY